MSMFLFLLLGTFWGGSYVAIKWVVAEVPPFWAGTLRMSAALLLLTFIYRASGKSFGVAKSVRHRVWLAGLFSQGIPFSLLFWGERAISPGLAGILNGTTPLFTFVLGLLFMRKNEPFTRPKMGGLALGIVGMLLIFGPKLLGSGSQPAGSLAGTIAVALMALSYAIGSILNRALFLRAGADKPDLYASLFNQLSASFVYLLALSLLVEGPPALGAWLSHPWVVGGTLYLGWCSTAIAFMLFYTFIRKWGAFKASMVAYLIPVAAVTLDFFINGIIPSELDLLGSLVILLGVFLIQGQSLLESLLARFRGGIVPSCAP